MTDAELDRLAALVADSLLRARVVPAAAGSATGPWLPIPVRPEISGRGGEPPVWSGAAQALGEAGPARGAPSSRATTAELTNATRAKRASP